MLQKCRWTISTLVLLALFATPGGTWRARVNAAPSLSDLRGVEELKTLFAEDAGKVRLVLLVSPT
jgi:hypothetical protein